MRCLFLVCLAAAGLFFPAAEASAPEKKPGGYTIITAEAIEPSTQELKTAIKNVFGDITAQDLDCRTAAARRLIKRRKIEFIPYVIFDKDIESNPEFSKLAQRGMIVKQAGEYIIPQRMIVPLGGEFFKRPRQPDQLDLFVMSKCPAGNDALRRVLECFERYPRDFKVVVHYITTFHEFGISSLHGPEEIKENIRQILIQKHYPEKFWEYQLLYRQGKGFELICRELKLDPFKVTDYHRKGRRLLKKDFELCRELGVWASPTFLWENQLVFTSLDKFKEYLAASESSSAEETAAQASSENAIEVAVFYDPHCAGCHWVLDEYIPLLKDKFTGIKFTYYNIAAPKNYARMQELEKERGLDPGAIPKVVVGEQVLVGREEIATQLEALLQETIDNQ